MNLLHVHVMLLLLVLLLVVVVVLLLLLLLLLNGECVRGSSDVLDGWVRRRRRSQTSQRTPIPAPHIQKGQSSAYRKAGLEGRKAGREEVHIGCAVRRYARHGCGIKKKTPGRLGVWAVCVAVRLSADVHGTLVWTLKMCFFVFEYSVTLGDVSVRIQTCGA
jgi:hypothetical protein